MHFLKQLFAFMFSWRKQVWIFRTRFVNEYNAWIIEIREKEIDGFKPLCHRRTDADHELMVVKFVTRTLALEYANETGLPLNYQEVATNLAGWFRVQWKYRIRLDLNSNNWLIETQEEENKDFRPLFEYVAVPQRRGEFHRLNMHFDAYQDAKRHVQKIGLDKAYKEERFSPAAPDVQLMEATTAAAQKGGMSAHLQASGSTVRALPNRN